MTPLLVIMRSENVECSFEQTRKKVMKQINISENPSPLIRVKCLYFLGGFLNILEARSSALAVELLSVALSTPVIEPLF